MAVLELAADGASAPFIARYRRDRTGNLAEPAVRRVLQAHEQWERLVARQNLILESVERHATITPELREKLLTTFDGDALEDIYLPYKQKKKSRASDAREAGLAQLADWIWDCGHGTETPQEGQTLELWAFTFRNPEKGVPDAKTAIEGARDIIVERLAEDATLRAAAREVYADGAWLRASRTEKAKPGSRFEPYYEFHESVASLLDPSGPPRYLALRRGQSEGELLLAVTGPPDDPEFDSKLVSVFESAALSVPDSPGAEVLRQAARIAFKGHVRTTMENETHRRLKEAADAAASRVHAEALRRLLLEPPFGARPVLGIDPAGRGGSRLAVVDATGACLASGDLHLQTDEQKRATRDLVVGLFRAHAVQAVAVGDGAGGRDCEVFVRAALKEAGLDAPVVLVGEAGAGAWGSSDAVREELPDLDPTARGAVFVARRLQDPMRELVKIEPRTLCGRQHAHDVTPAALVRALEAVLEACVHQVGVDLNAAPRQLLARVSGIGPALAGAIVERRAGNGPFRTREELRRSASRPEGVRALRRLPADPRRGAPLRRHRRPPRALRSPRSVGEAPWEGAGRSARVRQRRCARRRDARGGARAVGAGGRPARARARRPRLAGGVHPVLVPRGRPGARRPEARDGVPWHRQQRGELRCLRRHRHRPGRPRARVAAGSKAREGPAGGDRARGAGPSPGAEGGPGQEAGLPQPEAGPGAPGPGDPPPTRAVRRRQASRLQTRSGREGATSGAARARSHPSTAGQGPPPRPTRERRPAFNNPFSVLADMKLPKRGKP